MENTTNSGKRAAHIRPPNTIIIPAHNEAGYITACLQALMAQSDTAGVMRIIVAANACTDDTVARCHALVSDFAARGASLEVLDLPEPGKIAALNSAEAGLPAGPRLYLDADVICAPELVGQICAVLETDEPRYATGTLKVAEAKSAITQAYARLWQKLPFVRNGAVGAGLFALNASGRARWKQFPDIISDDTFVRLNFAPEERIEVPAKYLWPMIEGFNGLVQVRRRQDAGVAQVRKLYPQLLVHDTVAAPGLATLARLALRHPWAFAVYVSVSLAVKAGGPTTQWVRGR